MGGFSVPLLFHFSKDISKEDVCLVPFLVHFRYRAWIQFKGLSSGVSENGDKVLFFYLYHSHLDTFPFTISRRTMRLSNWNMETVTFQRNENPSFDMYIHIFFSTDPSCEHQMQRRNMAKPYGNNVVSWRRDRSNQSDWYPRTNLDVVFLPFYRI